MMNPKMQFVLYSAFSILGVAMMLFGFLELQTEHLRSLFYLGIGLGMQGQLFSVRTQSNTVRWMVFAVSSFLAFGLAGLAVMDNVYDTKFENLKIDGQLALVFYAGIVIACVWEIAKEYRAMRKNLGGPPDG